MDVWLAAGVLLSLTLAEGQTISGPDTIGIGQDLTLSCNFVPGAGQTIETYQWLFTGAATALKVFDDCTVFNEGSLAGYSYTKQCNVPVNHFTLTLQAVTPDTLSKNWCCNVGLVGGGAGTESCKTVGIDADCGNPTAPTNGQVSLTTSTTTYLSEATYSCNSDYTIDKTPTTTTCQADGTWSGSVPTCRAADGCFSQAGCTAGVVLGIYGLSWMLAIVVLLVINGKDQNRFPWHVCAKHLKKVEIWIPLFLFLPYVPSFVTIYLFITCSGKPTKPVISPKSVSVNVGDMATFTCTSSSTTDPAESGLTMNYTWRRNRVDMKSEGRYIVSGQTLTVTKVVKGDASDKFTCIAQEVNGLTSDESDSARIVIIGYCRCVGAPGTDLSINFKYTVSSSGEVTVQVKNEAGTILVSVKFIDGKVAGKADINPRVDFTRNDTTGDLSFKLNNIQTSDSGLYTLSGNDVPCSCATLYVTDKPTSGTEMNTFGESDQSIPLLTFNE